MPLASIYFENYNTHLENSYIEFHKTKPRGWFENIQIQKRPSVTSYLDISGINISSSSCSDISIQKHLITCWRIKSSNLFFLSHSFIQIGCWETVLCIKAVCYRSRLWAGNQRKHAFMSLHLVWRLEMRRMLSGGPMQLLRNSKKSRISIIIKFISKLTNANRYS